MATPDDERAIFAIFDVPAGSPLAEHYRHLRAAVAAVDQGARRVFLGSVRRWASKRAAEIAASTAPKSE